MWLLWISVALGGGSLAGTGVPSVGGSFAGPTEAGALGVIFQPAAAARGESPELVIDLGAIATQLTRSVDTWQAPLQTGGISAQPTLMLAVPVGPVGFGAAVHGSYLRGGDGEADGEQRLFTISSTLSMIEGDVYGAVQPTDFITLGAGLRMGLLTFESFKGIDFGATLNNGLAPEPPLPVSSELLEGSQRLGSMSAFNVSWTAGLALQLDPMQLDVAFRPAWKTTMRGPIALVPSNDLNASIDGTIDLTLPMPAHVFLGGRVALSEQWTLATDLEWVGWGAAGRNSATISGLILTSSDPLLNTVLGASGLSEADFLTSQEGVQDADLGWHDVVNIAAQTMWEPDPRIELRAGVGFSPTAIPIRLVTPSNLDFSSIVFKLGAGWRPAKSFRLAVSGERYQTLTRRVTNSPYSLENPPEGLGILPSANGTYSISLWRAALTLQMWIPTKEESP